MEDKQPPKRKCIKCSHIWRYKGKRKYFCCPDCMSSAQHPKIEE